MLTSIRISEAEYRSRCARLQEYLRAQGLAGGVLFDSYYILYYTGFAFMPTERPMAFVLNAEGETALFVPRLELEHAQANALVGRLAFYPEYPADPHPMETLRQLLADMGVAGQGAAFGADQDGYPWILVHVQTTSSAPATVILSGSTTQPAPRHHTSEGSRLGHTE